MQILIDTCSSYIKGSTKSTTLSEILLRQLVQVCEKTEKTVEPGMKYVMYLNLTIRFSGLAYHYPF